MDELHSDAAVGSPAKRIDGIIDGMIDEMIEADVADNQVDDLGKIVSAIAFRTMYGTRTCATIKMVSWNTFEAQLGKSRLGKKAPLSIEAIRFVRLSLGASQGTTEQYRNSARMYRLKAYKASGCVRDLEDLPKTKLNFMLDKSVKSGIRRRGKAVPNGPKHLYNTAVAVLHLYQFVETQEFVDCMTNLFDVKTDCAKCLVVPVTQSAAAATTATQSAAAATQSATPAVKMCLAEEIPRVSQPAPRAAPVANAAAAQPAAQPNTNNFCGNAGNANIGGNIARDTNHFNEKVFSCVHHHHHHHHHHYGSDTTETPSPARLKIQEATAEDLIVPFYGNVGNANIGGNFARDTNHFNEKVFFVVHHHHHHHHHYGSDTTETPSPARLKIQEATAEDLIVPPVGPTTIRPPQGTTKEDSTPILTQAPSLADAKYAKSSLADAGHAKTIPPESSNSKTLASESISTDSSNSKTLDDCLGRSLLRCNQVSLTDLPKTIQLIDNAQGPTIQKASTKHGIHATQGMVFSRNRRYGDDMKIGIKKGVDLFQRIEEAQRNIYDPATDLKSKLNMVLEELSGRNVKDDIGEYSKDDGKFNVVIDNMALSSDSEEEDEEGEEDQKETVQDHIAEDLEGSFGGDLGDNGVLGIEYNFDFSSPAAFQDAFKSPDYVLNFVRLLLETFPTISHSQFMHTMENKFKGGDYSEVFNALVEPIVPPQGVDN